MTSKNNVTITKSILDFETAYSRLNKKFFKGVLPWVTITIMPDLTKGAYGWMTTKKVWKNQDGIESYELNICAEFMDRPLEELVGTLLHEMVHIYDAERGIKDCSRGGYFHNKNFKETAENHGLVCNETSDKRVGYGYTTLSEPAKKWVLENLKDIYRITREPWKVKKIRTTKTHSIKYVCPACGMSVRATKEVNVICADCGVMMGAE